MSGSSLPLWVQVLQALAVPVIAAVSAWVAWQQMHIARTKLQHDRYDRRYAVFQAVRGSSMKQACRRSSRRRPSGPSRSNVSKAV